MDGQGTSIITAKGCGRYGLQQEARHGMTEMTISEGSIPCIVLSVLLRIIEWSSDKIQLSVYVSAFQVFVCKALQCEIVTLYISTSIVQSA